MKLKINHMINFINLVNENFQDEKIEKDIANILEIDQHDFYTNYLLAYIRCIQLRLPECSELLFYLRKKYEKSKDTFYLTVINSFSNFIKGIL